MNEGTWALGRICIEAGTRYDVGREAANALSLLQQSDEQLLDDAIGVWSAIVDEGVDTDRSMERKSADNARERRLGAMRALATLTRSFPGDVPIELFLDRTTDEEPVVRIYASYALSAIARRQPARLRGHLPRLIEGVSSTPNPLGADTWGKPKLSASNRWSDELAAAKLARAALETALRVDMDDVTTVQDVLADIGEKLGDDAFTVVDTLVDLLPAEAQFWSPYVEVLEASAAAAERDSLDDPVVAALCYRIESTCEDWRDAGALPDGFTDERVASSLGTLQRARSVVSPDQVAPLNRAFGDFVRALLVETTQATSSWAGAPRAVLHERLTDPEASHAVGKPVESALADIVDSTLTAVTTHASDSETLADRSLLYPIDDVAAFAPATLRPHVEILGETLQATASRESDQARGVFSQSCRGLAQVGAAFPAAVTSVAPVAVEALQKTISSHDYELLDDALAAATITATHRPDLLESFTDRFVAWSRDPPRDESDDPLRIPTIDSTDIQYFAVVGLGSSPTDVASEMLRDVTTDADVADRVRDLARTVQNSDGP